jgi:hypothetical protein
MCLRCGFVLAAFLSVLPLALGGDRAASLVQFIRPSSVSERQLVLEAKFLCGMFDGKFGCKNAPGVVEHGKNAIPGAPEETDQPEGMTGGAGQGTTAPVDTGQGASGGTPDAATTCQHGMAGTPPDNCHCPKNSELLGGNCVHYTATCSNGLPADSLPQPCRGAEEKLACKTRQDGLKDCCCLTYDKL